MLDIVQVFLTYVGITMLVVGCALCMVASAFRYGVFCTIVGNVFLVSAIVFPVQITQFLRDVGVMEAFSGIDQELLKTKAVMFGCILMGGLWSIRWLKHLIVEGLLYFVFPSLAKPNIVEQVEKNK